MAVRNVVLAVALWVVAFGCRRFDVCGTPEEPCEREALAEVGGAGSGDGGGREGPNACTARRASCDHSTLNGCETNLDENPRHCGACDQECAGVCTLGSCVPFEVRVPDVYDPMANVLVTASAAFFVASPNFTLDAMSLGRYDLASGEVTWLAEGAWEDVAALAATATRLYVVGDLSLYSMSLSGGELRNEGLSFVEAISTAGTTVAVVADGEARVRSDDDGEFVLIPGDGYPEAVSATLTSVFVARDADSGFTIEEFSSTYDKHEIVATGSGYVRALHVFRDFASAYIATESEYDSHDWVIRSVSWFTTSEPLVEFPWDTRWVITESPSPLADRTWIGTYSEGTRDGLRLATLSQQSFTLEWPIIGEIETLSASETELWFVDPLRHALVSIDLEDVIDKAVAVPLTD